MQLRQNAALAKLARAALAASMFPERPVEPAREPVRTWLYIVALLIFCLVVVGGATRLTDSGLSITEWKPILGIIPPLSDADWATAFSKYQEIPEYKLQNAGMSLQDFKFIFWWEWAHRFLARFIGIVFVVPFVWFAIRGRIGRRLWPSLVMLLLLGAAQGALGWFMVYSGLTERVDVSQYRLSAHLTLASAIFAAILWVGLGVGRQRQRPSEFADYIAGGLVLLVLFQIAAGGFVAGLDAGMGYNTWPKMEGAWIPDGLAAMQPVWRNLFENALTVQFQHRLLAYVILVFACWHAWQSFSLSAMALLYAVFAQVIVGITTLLLHVPIAIALMHQAMALVVLLVAVWNLHSHLVINSLPVQDQQ